MLRIVQSYIRIQYELLSYLHTCIRHMKCGELQCNMNNFKCRKFESIVLLRRVLDWSWKGRGFLWLPSPVNPFQPMFFKTLYVYYYRIKTYTVHVHCATTPRYIKTAAEDHGLPFGLPRDSFALS